MKRTTFHYSGTMDPECLALCDAMNQKPRITTLVSCCGHGKDNFRIWFKVGRLSALPDLLYWFDPCHCGFFDWRVTVKTDCAKSPPIFCIEGPVGESAYREAKQIAAMLREDNSP